MLYYKQLKLSPSTIPKSTGTANENTFFRFMEEVMQPTYFTKDCRG